MTFLVTGGSGFIGAALVRALCARRHTVRAFFRSGDDSQLLNGLPAERLEGDICDREALTAAARGCEGVFHTAGNLSFLKRDRAIQSRVNVDGAAAVVDACLQAGVRRLVHTSSVNACGIPYPQGTIGDEATPFNWEGVGFHYALTKRAGEQIALAADGPRLEVVVVNPGTVFGPGDIHRNAGSYILAIQKSPVFFYPGGGANVVPIATVVAGHLAAFDRGRPGQRYILGGENLTYRQIFTTIADVLRRPTPRFAVPYPAAMAAARLIEAGSRISGRPARLSVEAVRAGYLKLFYSSAKAERELGLPRLPFRRAVEEAADWYARHP